ncbi:MAG: FAD synthetase family protein [Alistipes sp.]|nr:FAD synthetase family protein [Alistipes sp.]
MRVFRGIESLPALRNAVATMGSFDGVHCGHRELLERVMQRARELQGESVVITFDPHPRYVLGTGEGMQLLSTIEEKIFLLEQIGIGNLIIIPFTLEFSRTSPMEFIGSLAAIGIRSMVVGYNHRFGHNKEGDFEYLSTHSGEMEITKVEQQQVAGGKVSSTIIRQCIADGDMQRVEQMLAHPYIIIGKVGEDGIISDISENKLLPAVGEYQAKVNGEENKISISQSCEISFEKPVEMGEVLIEVL